MKAGIVMNIVCVCVITVMINTLGIPMFDVMNFPEWAENPDTTNETLRNLLMYS